MRKKQLSKILNNLSNVQQIKLEDSKVYSEYSVIIISQHYSDIIICETSKQANKLYSYLTEKLNEYKQQKENNVTI